MEDNVLARLYRESPINAIWKGSGNIQCLDLMRAIKKSRDEYTLRQLIEALALLWQAPTGYDYQ